MKLVAKKVINCLQWYKMQTNEGIAIKWYHMDQTGMGHTVHYDHACQTLNGTHQEHVKYYTG
jgi:hypothetical protein